jgi:hypothetical protein
MVLRLPGKWKVVPKLPEKARVVSRLLEMPHETGCVNWEAS